MHYFRNEKDILKEFTAYLYLVELSNGKFYAGRHNCKINNKIDLSYICSSENKEFWDDFTEDAGNQKIAILEVGTVSFVTQREKDYLTKVDARNNDSYYNDSNSSGGKSSDINLGLVSRVLAMIEDGTYPQAYVDKGDLFEETIAYQIRKTYIHNDHANYLSDRMADAGNADDFPPIVIMEKDERGQKGRRLGGNHTLQAAQLVTGFSKIYSVVIPKYTKGKQLGWSNLSDDTLEKIGFALNPEPKKKALPNSKLDIATSLIRSEKTTGVEIDSDINKIYLKDYLHLTSTQVKSYIKFAVDKRDNDEFDKNSNFITYTPLQLAKEKNKLTKEKDNIYVWDTSAGYFKLDDYVDFVHNIYIKLKHYKFTVIVLMHYSSFSTYLKVQSEKKNSKSKGLSAIKWLSKELGYKSTIKTLKYEQKRVNIVRNKVAGKKKVA